LNSTGGKDRDGGIRAEQAAPPPRNPLADTAQ